MRIKLGVGSHSVPESPGLGITLAKVFLQVVVKLQDQVRMKSARLSHRQGVVICGERGFLLPGTAAP
jgi:hypothetical protein